MNTDRRLKAASVALMVGILSPVYTVASTPSGSAPPAPLACEAMPQDYLDGLLENPKLQRSHWGVLVQPLTAASDQITPPPKPWLSHNAEQFFNPASNAKLLTTAAVLTRLGRYHYVNTALVLEPSSQSPPSLRIHTIGNPALNQAALDHFADAVKQKGLTAVDTVWVDAEDIGLVREGRISSWEWGDLPFGYGSPASTAIFNNNQLTLTLTGTEPGQAPQMDFSDPIAAQQWVIHNQVITDDNAPAQITFTPGWPNILLLTGTLPPGETNQTALAVPNPPQYLGDAFKYTLEQRGISVAQVRISRNARIQPSQGHSVLTSYSSPSSGDLVTTINRFSNNLYAEVLLGWLGIQSIAPNLKLPEERSRQVLEDALTQLNVEPTSYRVADGSGLSRQNLVTPQALVTVLNGMWRSPETLVFRQSLPIAGETGTLRDRFKDTVLEGRLIAKTGTLTGVSALSGYFPYEDQTWVAFSILVNHSNQPASMLRQAMDDLLVAIAETPRHCLVAN
ncbi:MAG: D-alanyl-D-alanine carboxypeptidase/D-alanyl-D-alanine-endopeptidase [Cyanobacteria bacterium P01_C01_bin.89]